MTGERPCHHDRELGVDVQRGRATVPDHLVGAVAVQVADAGAIDPEYEGVDLPALVHRSADAAGLDADGIRAHLARVLAPTAAVAVDVFLRRIGRSGELHDRFWVGAAGATHGERRPCGCWLLGPTAAPYVPVRIAELHGIGPGTALAGGPITVTGPDLEALEEALATGGPDAAAGSLVDRGHTEIDARAVVLLATRTTTKLALSATWAGRAGVETHQVEHLSADGSLWRVETDGDDRTFVPLGPTDAFADIAGLLPGGDALRLPAPWSVRAGGPATS